MPDPIPNLQDQLAAAPPEARAALQALLIRAKSQAAADKALVKLLADVNAELVKTLRALAADPGSRANLLSARLDTLRILLDSAGIQRLHDQALENYGKVLQANLDATAKMLGVPVAALRVDTVALEALMVRQWETLWETKVIVPALADISAGFTQSLMGASLTQTITAIQGKLGISAGRAATAARTDLALFDRVASEETGAASGLEFRLYQGPDDGIVRPFCKACVGKVFTIAQVAALKNNVAGSPPPIFAGGGPNCRHSFVAISQESAEAAGYPFATGADVAAANSTG